MLLIKTLQMNDEVILPYGEPVNVPWKVAKLSKRWGMYLCG